MIAKPTAQAAVDFSNPMKLIAVAKKGLSKSIAEKFAQNVALSDREMARILNISERTYHRYRPENVLDTATTERLLQLFLLYKNGEDIFENIEVFKEWLKLPHILFGNKTPLDILDTITGFRLVENELGRIEYGVYI